VGAKHGFLLNPSAQKTELEMPSDHYYRDSMTRKEVQEQYPKEDSIEDDARFPPANLDASISAFMVT
jgi:hypothetical protein